MAVPLVSVVMSVYNGERFLRDAMESILGQSFRDFEFIVVNDGSDDRSGEILESYQKQDARTQICHQEHRGLVRSLNRGCRLARGRYIARMDADDVASVNRLIWQLDFMKNHPQIAVLGGAVEWINATGELLALCRNPLEDQQIKAELVRRNAFWHSTVFMLKEAFVSAGGYRTAALDAEDYDLWLRMAGMSQFANLSQVVLRYRIHPCQVSMSKRRQQSLSKLAVQVSAACRARGEPDPLDTPVDDTRCWLRAMGVSEARVNSELAADCRDWVRNQLMAGEYPAALAAATDFVHCDMTGVEKGLEAELYILIARLYWRQKRVGQSLLAALRAVISLPSATVTLLKGLAHSFRRT